MTEPNSEDRASLLVGRINLGNLSLKLPVIGAPVGLKEVDVGYVFGPLGDQQWQKMRSLLGGTDISLPNERVQQGGFLQASVDVGGTQVPILVPFAQGQLSAAMDEAMPVETVGEVAADGATPAMWRELNRSLGPVEIERVGIGYDSSSKAVLVLLDGAIGGGGLRLATKGLGAGIPFANPNRPVFHLDGLSMGYSRPPVTLAGEFIKQHRTGYSLALGGMAVLGTPVLSVSALGFYAQPESGGPPSLFVCGKLDLGKKSIGGPIFRLKQVAAGFGYQTRVRTPSISEIESFPFIEMMRSSSSKDPLTVLNEIVSPPGGAPWVYPDSDSIWLAAGLSGTVYELVDVTAVAVAQFGHDLTVGLYGTAEATFPKASASPWARLLLDVRAEYRSSKDTLEIDAAVAPGSFLVSENCELRGSAAVRVWFGRSEHPGEFVVTVGGYHPGFNKPDHYPAAQRLGFDWHISNNIYATGECYAAVTPHAFMAGFNTHVHGEWGPFIGDVRVYADALIEWNPFYFDLRFGGRVQGAVKVLGVRVPLGELSVDGQVWGPPVGGKCQLNVYRLKIPVSFGRDRQQPANSLKAEEFCAKMLPSDQQVVHVVPADGLRPGEKPSEDEEAVWTAGSGFRFDVGTAVPATEVTINEKAAVWRDPKVPGATVERASKLYIRPMQPESGAADGYQSKLSVSVLKGSTPVPVNSAESASWSATAITAEVPAALWGKRADRKEIAASKGGGLVAGYASSLRVAAPPPVRESPLPLPATALEARISTCEIPAEEAPSTFPGKQSAESLQNISSAIASESVRKAREAIVDELARIKISGLAHVPNSDLTRFSRAIDDLDANPLLFQES
ncbi:DUF6603 domain-containing protein [Streptomyces sp. NPDC055709]